jgi:hypothetical protein
MDEKPLSKNGCDRLLKELKAWWPEAPSKLSEELLLWCEGWQTEFNAQLTGASNLSFSEFSKYTQTTMVNGRPPKLHLLVKKYTFGDLFTASASTHQKGEVLGYGELATSVTDPTNTQTCQELLESGASDDTPVPHDALAAMDAAFVQFMVRINLLSHVLPVLYSRFP